METVICVREYCKYNNDEICNQECLSDESSEDKQARLKCHIGVSNWSCYIDCAFWDGSRCTNYESI